MKNDAYLTGFGNQHSTEAMAGALPIGAFSPQKVPLGLYAEKFSSTAFTAPRNHNRRSWFYRILPSVTRSSMKKLDAAYPNWSTAGITDKADKNNFIPDALRWDSLKVPETNVEFFDSIRTEAVCGDAASQLGGSVGRYHCTHSDSTLYHVNADAEFLLIPYVGRLTIHTECGALTIAPQQVVVIPRGLVWRISCLDGTSAGYCCENYGAPFELPERGPVGSDGFANDRDFEYPQAAFEENKGNCRLHRKISGLFFETILTDSPLDVVAWTGNSAPYRYDLRRFNTIGSISYDHPDPSIFTVLTSQSDTPGVANLDFVIFPPRWLVAQNTFRPPWFHRNCMSEWMGLIQGVYDAKPEGFVKGGMSLHNTMTPHGPDADAYSKAVESDLKPSNLTDTMAFMVESRYTLYPSHIALTSETLQKNYHAVWQGFEKKFKSQQYNPS